MSIETEGDTGRKRAADKVRSLFQHGIKRRGDGLDTIVLVVVVLFLLAFFGVWGLHL
jgi:hypothetical protein